MFHKVTTPPAYSKRSMMPGHCHKSHQFSCCFEPANTWFGAREVEHPDSKVLNLQSNRRKKTTFQVVLIVIHIFFDGRKTLDWNHQRTYHEQNHVFFAFEMDGPLFVFELDQEITGQKKSIHIKWFWVKVEAKKIYLTILTQKLSFIFELSMLGKTSKLGDTLRTRNCRWVCLAPQECATTWKRRFSGAVSMDSCHRVPTLIVLWNDHPSASVCNFSCMKLECRGFRFMLGVARSSNQIAKSLGC